MYILFDVTLEVIWLFSKRGLIPDADDNISVLV